MKSKNSPHFCFYLPVQRAERALRCPSLLCGFNLVPPRKEAMDREAFQSWYIPLMRGHINDDSRGALEPPFPKVF
jgi:hypothetical protein